MRLVCRVWAEQELTLVKISHCVIYPKVNPREKKKITFLDEINTQNVLMRVQLLVALVEE